MGDEGGTFNLTGLPAIQSPNKKIPNDMRLDDYEFGGGIDLKSPEKLSPVQVRKYFGEAAKDRLNQRWVLILAPLLTHPAFLNTLL